MIVLKHIFCRSSMLIQSVSYKLKANKFMYVDCDDLSMEIVYFAFEEHLKEIQLQ